MVKGKIGITQDVLEKVAKELNKLFGLKKPECLAFTKKGGIEAFKADILEAATQLTEDDDVSKFTLNIIENLKSPKKEEKKEEKKEHKEEKKEEKKEKKKDKKGFSLKSGSLSEKAFLLFQTGKYSHREVVEKTGSKTNFNYLLNKIRNSNGDVEVSEKGKVLVKV